eukprot:2436345-Prymnesium_polylepis.1
MYGCARAAADVGSSLCSTRVAHGGLNFDLDWCTRSDGGVAPARVGRGERGGGGGSLGGRTEGGCWSSSSHSG